MPRRIWTEEMVAYLREHYRSYKDAGEIAKKLNLTNIQVIHKAQLLKISAKGKYAKWSREEEELLQEWIHAKQPKDIYADWQSESEKRGWPKRTLHALRNRCNLLNYY